jgi:hypothetical protein
MLGEDEIALNWHIDTTPLGRARSRSVYDFDRMGDIRVLPGRIAYERLREMEHETLKKQPTSPLSSGRSYGRRQRLSQQTDGAPLSNGNCNTPSAARLRALAEYEAELAEAAARRQRQAKENEKSAEIELISFTIRYEDIPSSTNNDNSLGRLLCEWILPSSSSDINYYTIERQLDDQEWLPIEEKIDKSQNQRQLDIFSLLSQEKNPNSSSRFRLKAHLENGKIFTSPPTDEINLHSIVGKRLIIPDVEILSANSVQLTWNNEENNQINLYDIEKKEAHETEWTKVTIVPFSQGSARIDNLIDAPQCHFRLVPSTSDKSIKSGLRYSISLFYSIFSDYRRGN